MSEARAYAALSEYLDDEKAQTFTLSALQAKSLNPTGQVVYAALSPDYKLAVKLDLTSRGPERLSAEFENLRTIKPAFKDTPTLDIITPHYLSADQHALITSFCPTGRLRENVGAAQTPQQIYNIMLKAGEWVAAFHATQAQETKRVWPGWMIEKARNLAETIPRTPASDALATRALSHMHSQLPPLKGRLETFGIIHNDLNSANLLADETSATGLDFLAPQIGLQLVDVAYLLCDTNVFLGNSPKQFTDASAAGLLKGYGRKIDPDLFAFTYKMYHLFTWLRITPERLDASSNLRSREIHIRNCIGAFLS